MGSDSKNVLYWAIKGMIAVGSVRFLALPITLIAAIILGRFLGPEAYGAYSFSMSLAELIALPVGLGLKGLIIRTVAVAKKSKDYESIARVRLTSLYAVAIYFSFSILFSLTFFYISGNWYFPLIAALFLAPNFAIYEIYGGILQGLERPIQSQLTQLLLRPLVFLILVTVAWWLGFLNLTLVYAIFIVSSVLAFVFLYLPVRSSLSLNVSSGRLLSLNKDFGISYLSFVSIASVQFFSMNAGILFLGMLGDNIGSAGMRVAQSAGLLVVFPVAAAEILTQPRLARLVGASNKKEFKETYKASARVSLVLSLSIGIPMYLFAEALLKITYGAEYVPIALDAIRIIVIARVVQALMGTSGVLLTMTSNERSALIAQIYALIITMVALLYLGPLMSTRGAAIAIALGVFSKVIIEAYFIRCLYGQWYWAFMKVTQPQKKD